jgi:hypothetical protein
MFTTEEIFCLDYAVIAVLAVVVVVVVVVVVIVVVVVVVVVGGWLIYGDLVIIK